MTSCFRALVGPVAIAAVVLSTGCVGGESGTLTDGSDASGPGPPEREDLSAGESDPVEDPLYPEFGNPGIDVLHYGLDLEYQPDSRVLDGAATLTIRPVEAAEELVLDLSEAMSVDEVVVDGEPADFAQAEWDLTVDVSLTAEDNVVVEVSYAGTPETVPAPAQRSDMSGGLGASVGPEGQLWSFQEPFGALTWYPVNDHPSDEALYDIALTVPEGYAGVASGAYMGKEGDTYHWSSAEPKASYAATIAVDAYELHELTGPDDLPVTVWATPEQSELLPTMERIPEMIDWLQQRYGPYPFESSGVVLVGGESAMETQEMITFSAGLLGMSWADEDYVAGVMVHELAHQWFGNAVTPLDWTNLWINEGPATYIEQLWRIDQGEVSEADVISDFTTSDAQLRSQHGPPGDPDPQAFASSNSYVPPALMLFALRDEIGGAEAVDELLAEWVVAHMGQQVERDDFVEFVNSHVGEDLTEFIDEWLDSTTTP